MPTLTIRIDSGRTALDRRVVPLFAGDRRAEPAEVVRWRRPAVPLRQPDAARGGHGRPPDRSWRTDEAKSSPRSP